MCHLKVAKINLYLTESSFNAATLQGFIYCFASIRTNKLRLACVTTQPLLIGQNDGLNLETRVRFPSRHKLPPIVQKQFQLTAGQWTCSKS